MGAVAALAPAARGLTPSRTRYVFLLGSTAWWLLAAAAALSLDEERSLSCSERNLRNCGPMLGSCFSACRFTLASAAASGRHALTPYEAGNCSDVGVRWVERRRVMSR